MKAFMLRFLPYLETPDGRPVQEVIGPTPPYISRHSGYGRWEELFDSLEDARERLRFLIEARVIEDAEIRRDHPDNRLGVIVEEWKADC
jgi:hypothetical protein